jgi:uncharacterized membrane protein YdcZ (DUF606 family)
VNEFLQILTLILTSSIKFAFAIPFVYLNERYEFTWLQTNLYAVLGGMLGVVFFMYCSEGAMYLWDRLRAFYFRKKSEFANPFSDPVADVEDKLNIRYEYIDPNAVPKRKVFTPRTRRIVRVWSRYGLIGLAAITPILLSIPIGTFFITRLERNKKKILLYMFISIASWSLLLTTVFEFTNTQHLQDFLR